MASALVWAAACSVYDAPSRDDDDAASSGSSSGGALSGSGGKAITPVPGSGAAAEGEAGDGGPAEEGAGSGGTPETGGGGEGPTARGGAGATEPPLDGAGGAGEPAGGAAGSSGSTSAGSGGGGSGGGGSGTLGHGYVKLVAKSEQQGQVWTSVAELQVLTTAAQPLDRALWTITADSEETFPGAPAENVADGNPDTYWHSYWEYPLDSPDNAPLPHHLIIDLGITAPITGFSLLPRQDSGNGRIKAWEFYVSEDGSNWGTPVASGSFPNTTALQTVKF